MAILVELSEELWVVVVGLPLSETLDLIVTAVAEPVKSPPERSILPCIEEVAEGVGALPNGGIAMMLPSC